MATTTQSAEDSSTASQALGALAGSVLLGPGVGTQMGAAVGGMINAATAKDGGYKYNVSKGANALNIAMTSLAALINDPVIYNQYRDGIAKLMLDKAAYTKRVETFKMTFKGKADDQLIWGNMVAWLGKPGSLGQLYTDWFSKLLFDVTGQSQATWYATNIQPYIAELERVKQQNMSQIIPGVPDPSTGKDNTTMIIGISAAVIVIIIIIIIAMKK